MYVVLFWTDYRKENEIRIHRVFQDRDQAIEEAQKFYIPPREFRITRIECEESAQNHEPTWNSSVPESWWNEPVSDEFAERDVATEYSSCVSGSVWGGEVLLNKHCWVSPQHTSTYQNGACCLSWSPIVTVVEVP